MMVKEWFREIAIKREKSEEAGVLKPKKRTKTEGETLILQYLNELLKSFSHNLTDPDITQAQFNESKKTMKTIAAFVLLVCLIAVGVKGDFELWAFSISSECTFVYGHVLQLIDSNEIYDISLPGQDRSSKGRCFCADKGANMVLVKNIEKVEIIPPSPSCRKHEIM